MQGLLVRSAQHHQHYDAHVSHGHGLLSVSRTRIAPPRCLFKQATAGGARLLAQSPGAVSDSTSSCSPDPAVYDLPGKVVVLRSYNSNPQYLSECVQTVGTALGDDPLAEYLARRGRTGAFFRALLPYLLSEHPQSNIITYRITTREGATVCAALCYKIPVTDSTSWPALFSKNALAALTSMQPSILPAFLRGVETFDRNKERFLKAHGGRAFYVFAIGTDRAHRSKGLGRIAMQALADHADKLQLPIYLEATNTRSAALYTRLGFQTLSIEPFGATGPPITYMWRPPISDGEDEAKAATGASIAAVKCSSGS